MALEHEDELLFIHTLTTLDSTITVSLSQNTEGVFLNTLNDDMVDNCSVCCIRIQDPDANDILSAMTRVNQMINKAVSLGDKVC